MDKEAKNHESGLLCELKRIAAAGKAGDFDVALYMAGFSHEDTEIARLVNEVVRNYRMVTEYDLMKYKLVNDALGIALWDMDVEKEDPTSPNNKITWSQELRDMLGFSNETDFPNTITALASRFHPDDSDMAFAAFAAHFNDRTGKTPYNIEYRLKHKNGEYRWFHGFGTTLRDSAGVPIRVAGAVMDINERKETQNQLMIMSSIVQHSPNFVSYKILNGECLYVNPAATKLTGFTQDELKRDYIGSLFDKETAQFISNKVPKELIETGISHYEAKGKTKNDEVIIFEGTSFLVEKNAFATVATDVTEAKKIETERMEALNALEYSKKLTDTLNKAAIIFLSQHEETFENMMTSGLKPFCDAADLDRVSVWRNFPKPDGMHVSQIYRWDRESGGTTKPTAGLDNVTYAELAPRWEGLLANGEFINSPTSLLPEAAMLKSFGIVSAFVTPVFISNVFWGFTLFEDRQNERYFDDDFIDVMRSAAFLCTNTVIRYEMEQEIIEAEVLKQTREADERTKIIFDTAPIACLMFDKDFNIYDCNQETVKMFGLPDKQVFLENFFKLSPEHQPDGGNSREMALEHNRIALKAGYDRFEWMHQTLSGEPMPCEVTLVRVKYRDEYNAACYVRDLREHKALLNEIHKENERNKTMAHWYESLLDAIPFLISVQDKNENWTFINTAAETFLNKTREEIVGLPCKSWGLSICNTDECAIDCAKRGQMRTYFSHENTFYQVDVKILEDLGGKVAGYIEIIQDITKMERMVRQQMEIDAASSAKSFFLSAMSHEMKTPMNAIIGMTAIGKNADNMERKDHALNKIETASKQLMGLINDVLDITNIEANRLELANIAFDIRDPIQKALFLVRSAMKDKRIHLTINLDKNMPFFFVGDDQRLTQVMSNLLSNAVKFTPNEGKISFTVSLVEKKDGICDLRFEVSDTGIGISPEQKERIFLAFEQADKGLTRRYGGAGLGLFLSKRIIELMGGRIWVESELGKGSLFIFTVKLLCNTKIE
ncbi:MAG: PAS domain S-box protein [Treponema sp.]|nr:PAS domain S-box protein [Treponema sp.]